MTAASRSRRTRSQPPSSPPLDPIETELSGRPPEPAEEPPSEETPEIDAPDQPLDVPGEAQAEREQLLQRIADLEDRLLRMAAECDNLRKRREREVREQLRFAGDPIVRDLIPVLDSLERATRTDQGAFEVAALREGLVMIKQQLHQALQRAGVERDDPTGEPFDPHRHEAMALVPDERVPADHVITVTEPGWRLHERVIRPARVLVSGGTPQQEEIG